MRKKPIIQRCVAGEASPWLQYIFNVGVIISQVGSVILLGDPDETISSRTGKAAEVGKWWFVYIQQPFINWMFMDPKHCQKAIEEDEGRKQLWDWAK